MLECTSPPDQFDTMDISTVNKRVLNKKVWRYSGYNSMRTNPESSFSEVGPTSSLYAMNLHSHTQRHRQRNMEASRTLRSKAPRRLKLTARLYRTIPELTDFNYGIVVTPENAIHLPEFLTHVRRSGTLNVQELVFDSVRGLSPEKTSKISTLNSYTQLTFSKCSLDVIMQVLRCVSEGSSGLLRKICLRLCTLTDDNLIDILNHNPFLKYVTELDLSHNLLTSCSLRVTHTFLPGLKVLGLRDNLLLDRDLHFLSMQQQLETLDLRDNIIRGYTLGICAVIPGLRKLSLSRETLSNLTMRYTLNTLRDSNRLLRVNLFPSTSE